MTAEGANSEDEVLASRASRCPQCGAPASAISRWPESTEVWRASCKRCGHAWREASRRTVADTLFHSGDLLILSVLVGITAIGVGIIALGLLSVLGAASSTGVFTVLIILCIAAFIAIGKQRIDSR